MTIEKENLTRLAEIVLRRTNYRENKMRVSMIISVGHLNGNIFNPPAEQVTTSEIYVEDTVKVLSDEKKK